MLLLASLIWGTAFVAQSAGMRYVGPFTFSALRSMLAAVLLIPLSFLVERGHVPANRRAALRSEFGAGALIGLTLFVAANFQQIGLLYTSAGKAGFITSLYIVIVPLLGLVFKQRVHPVIWVCVPLALAGFFLISVTDGFSSIGKGDLFELLCAFAFSAHILLVARFAPRMNALRLVGVSFLVASLLSIPVALLTETVSLSAIRAGWLEIVYVGVFSSCIAYSLQAIAQKRLEPASASLLCSPESVFAALSGAVLLGERMSGREILGCVLVFSAVVLSQLPWDRFLRRKSMI